MGWSLEGQEQSRPLQTKIMSVVVGNSQVVEGRDSKSAKCDQRLSKISQHQTAISQERLNIFSAKSCSLIQHVSVHAV